MVRDKGSDTLRDAVSMQACARHAACFHEIHCCIAESYRNEFCKQESLGAGTSLVWQHLVLIYLPETYFKIHF